MARVAFMQGGQQTNLRSSVWPRLPPIIPFSLASAQSLYSSTPPSQAYWPLVQGISFSSYYHVKLFLPSSIFLLLFVRTLVHPDCTAGDTENYRSLVTQLQSVDVGLSPVSSDPTSHPRSPICHASDTVKNMMSQFHCPLNVFVLLPPHITLCQFWVETQALFLMG